MMTPPGSLKGVEGGKKEEETAGVAGWGSAGRAERHLLGSVRCFTTRKITSAVILSPVVPSKTALYRCHPFGVAARPPNPNGDK